MLMTCIHGMISPVANIQANLLKAAQQIGVNEAAVFAYRDDGESDDDQNQRISQILGALDNNETLIVQSFSQISERFEQNIINHVRGYSQAKLVIVVTEVKPLYVEVHGGLHYYVTLYNQADVLIVQTKQMKRYLRYLGINHPQIVVAGLFDFPSNLSLGDSTFKHQINYIGPTDELPITEWQGQTKFVIYGNQRLTNCQTIPVNDQQILLTQLNQQGGFGIVSSLNHWGYDGYYQLMMPMDTSIFLASGQPLIARRGSATAALIQKYHVGLIYDHVNEIDSLVHNVNEEQYQQMVSQVNQLGRLVRQGQFINQAILKAEELARLSDGRDAVDLSESRISLNVMDNQATLDYIQKYRPSVARLGDGEISEIAGRSQIFQKANPALAKRLNEIAHTPSDEHLLVCLSDVFHDLDRFIEGTEDYWQGHLADYHDYYSSLAKLGHQYGNTMVTRPYIDFKNRTEAGKVFERIRQWWQDRDVLIAEGQFTRSGIGNDLFDNAKSVERIICPAKNAWDKYQEIEATIKQYGKGKLVLLMLGMTATVIAADLADWGQVIDIGHIDPEYEWYQMGATERVPLKNKHAAEFNNDYNMAELNDPIYQSQIIADLTK